MPCRRTSSAICAVTIITTTTFAHADPSAEELAKISQNPVGNVISVPIAYNGNFNYGSEQGTQSVLKIQPIIPFEINGEWNIITRWTFPLIRQPSQVAGDDTISGLSDTQLTAFLSPAIRGEWIWGAGPIVQAPTHTDPQLGNDHWGLGPSIVLVHLAKGDP